MVSKVLLFEGAPGAGKSTISEFVAEQLKLNGVAAEWLEEHVLEDQCFSEFGRKLRNSPKDAAHALLMDWDRLVAKFRASEGVVLLDGAYFGNTLKFLLAHDVPPDLLCSLAAQIDGRLMQFKPRVIYLTGDSGQIVRRAINQRSENWARFIARDVEAYPYQRARGRTGISGMTEFFVDAYELFEGLLELSSIPRVNINTELGDWETAETALLDLLGVSRRTPPATHPIDYERYVGSYRPPSGFPEPYNTPFAIENAGDGLRLHMVFHHNYHLVPESQTHFRIRTKPWVVEFVLNEDGDATAAVYPFIKEQRHVCLRISADPVRPVLAST